MTTHEHCLGVVVIGRNEGERLRACLESIVLHFQKPTKDTKHSVAPIIYVDSGSVDNSIGVARSFGAEVVQLELSRPFSAARARNAGITRLCEVAPTAKFVQFIDGDCMIAGDWLETAATFLESHPRYAVTSGRLRERFPEQSIYNRVCDIEWSVPVGDSESCGGVACFRVDAFRQIGGFDESVVCGEEPELCLRLRNAGWRIRRMDTEMAMHDAAMTRFAQWWKRSVRGGYGALDVATRFEKGQGVFSRQVRRARLWGVGWPLLVVVVTLAVFTTYGWHLAAYATLLTLAILPLQVARVGVKSMRTCGDAKTAFRYSTLMMLEKWANLQGQYRYLRDIRAGRHLSLIEYKQLVLPDDVV